MRSAVFDIACSFVMFVVDAISEYIVEVYSSIDLVTSLYVKCLDFEYGHCFGCFFCCRVVTVFVVNEFGVDGARTCLV